MVVLQRGVTKAGAKRVNEEYKKLHKLNEKYGYNINTHSVGAFEFINKSGNLIHGWIDYKKKRHVLDLGPVSKADQARLFRDVISGENKYVNNEAIPPEMRADVAPEFDDFPPAEDEDLPINQLHQKLQDKKKLTAEVEQDIAYLDDVIQREADEVQAKKERAKAGLQVSQLQAQQEYHDDQQHQPDYMEFEAQALPGKSAPPVAQPELRPLANWAAAAQPTPPVAAQPRLLVDIAALPGKSAPQLQAQQEYHDDQQHQPDDMDFEVRPRYNTEFDDIRIEDFEPDLPAPHLRRFDRRRQPSKPFQMSDEQVHLDMQPIENFVERTASGGFRLNQPVPLVPVLANPVGVRPPKIDFDPNERAFDDIPDDWIEMDQFQKQYASNVRYPVALAQKQSEARQRVMAAMGQRQPAPDFGEADLYEPEPEPEQARQDILATMGQRQPSPPRPPQFMVDLLENQRIEREQRPPSYRTPREPAPAPRAAQAAPRAPSSKKRRDKPKHCDQCGAPTSRGTACKAKKACQVGCDRCWQHATGYVKGRGCE